MEADLKTFRRVVIAYLIVFLAGCLLLFVPPSYAPWETSGVRDFFARLSWILAGPLALLIIIYPLVLRYRTGMARSK